MLFTVPKLYSSFFLGILYFTARTVAVPVGTVGLSSNRCAPSRWFSGHHNVATFEYAYDTPSKEFFTDLVRLILYSWSHVARSVNPAQPGYEFDVVAKEKTPLAIFSCINGRSCQYKIPISFGEGRGGYVAYIQRVKGFDEVPNVEGIVRLLSGRLEETGDCARTLMVFQNGLAQPEKWIEDATTVDMSAIKKKLA
ncbi:hypothetical protein J3R30DRAFT_3506196 [Lentinula aciculospora]|uniref:Uncharacterized protein n=1 Tax=Lentinula aciculospora TaxID=153920 RepID=A0A9W9A6Z0_9AGAR|nr:hypothetical protein J3R30DRAFT_3506196 [Lentinula aciculospora]